MQNNTSSVHLLNANGHSRVQVGNTYSTTNYYHKSTNQVDIAKTLHAFSPTDPRHDKKRIEDGNLLRDSYKWILDNEEFITWRNDSNGGRPLWIKGDPGKGKTMLLCGIINELQPYTKLNDPESYISLSYFFCQATISGLDNCTAVMKGLIYLLIAQQPCLVSYILDTQLPSSTHWNSRDAVEGIFDRVIADRCLQDTYMVVDALDECVDGLRYLLKLILNTRSRIKWIVSSRNRFDIDTFLGQTPANLHLSLELHEDCISQAVISYIDSRVDTLAARMRLKPELNQVVRQHLSEHARGTFLWVALVCKELERSKPWEIKKILSEIPEGLNELFTRMMDQILKSSSRDLYIRLLATTSIVFRPITFSELVAIEREMDINEDMLPAMVAECGSFLTTKEQTIFFIHQSAKDFLLTKTSGLLFPLGPFQHHCNLFQTLIGMLADLKKDIYSLYYPGVSLERAIHHRPIRDPLKSLEYACVFWANHLEEAHTLCCENKNKERILSYIVAAHQFVVDKFLFWLEALSYLQKISAAANALRFLQSLPTVSTLLSFRRLIQF